MKCSEQVWAKFRAKVGTTITDQLMTIYAEIEATFQCIPPYRCICTMRHFVEFIMYTKSLSEFEKAVEAGTAEEMFATIFNVIIRKNNFVFHTHWETNN